MAGPLTWRNVDAPDASVAMQGLRQMSNSLRQAFSGGAAALGDFKDQRAAAADQAGLAASLKFTDPAQYQEALRNGLIPQENMTAEGTANLGNRATQLLTQAGLGQEQLLGDQRLAAGQQLYDKRQTDAEIGAYNFGRQKTADTRADTAIADTLAATNALREVNRSAVPGDAAGTRAKVEAMRDSLSPLAYDQLLAAASTQHNFAGIKEFTGAVDIEGKPIGDPTAPNITASLPGTAGTKHGSPWDMNIGGVPSQPVSTMKMGDVYKFGREVLIPGNKGKYGNPEGVGSSATGAFQLTGETMAEYAPKVLGADWESQIFSPRNQDRIAEALFNDRKGGNLQATWQGLPNSTPGFYKDKSWADVRQEINNVESLSSTGRGLENVNTSAQGVEASTLVGTQKQDATWSESTAARALEQFGGSEKEPYDVATELAAKIKGNPVNIQDQITQVMKKGGVNAEVAGFLVESSLRKEDWWGRNIYNVGTDNVTDEQVVDEDVLTPLIAAAKGNRAPEDVMTLRQGKASLATVTALKTEQTEAQKLLNELQAGAQNNRPGYAEALPKQEAKVRSISDRLAAAVQAENRRQ